MVDAEPGRRQHRPEWEWLEQLARADETALCARIDDAGRMREFEVSVREVDLGQTFDDIRADEAIDVGPDIEDDIYAEAERLVEEMEHAE